MSELGLVRVDIFFDFISTREESDLQLLGSRRSALLMTRCATSPVPPSTSTSSLEALPHFEFSKLNPHIVQDIVQDV